MTALLRSEAIKLRSVRTPYALALAAGAAGAAGGSLMTQPVSDGVWVPMHLHPFLAMFVMIVAVLAYVLGARTVTDEFAHGTVAASLLASPGRPGFVVAKALTGATASMVLGAAAATAALAVVLPWSAANPARATTTAAQGLPLLGWLAAVAALYAAIGAGVAAVARHQVATLAGGVAWILVGEAVASAALRAGGRFLPGEAAAAVLGAPIDGLLTRWQGLLVLMAYAGAAVAAGILVMRRRDV